MTRDLPVAGANLGLEAIAWVPDAYLVSKGFIDESKNLPLRPGELPGPRGRHLLRCLEQNGMIYGYALDHAGGGFSRVATFVSGNPSIMDLNFDRDWATCGLPVTIPVLGAPMCSTSTPELVRRR